MRVRNENGFVDEIHNKHGGHWSMDRKRGQSCGEIARRKEESETMHCRTQQLRYADALECSLFSSLHLARIHQRFMGLKTNKPKLIEKESTLSVPLAFY